MVRLTDQFDSPWKEAWEIYFHPLLRFCFPEVEAAIDWTIPVQFRDKELPQFAPDSAVGRQYVDKLVQVQYYID